MVEQENLVEAYEREGYAIARGVLDPGLVSEARDHVAWLMRKSPDLRPENLGHFLMTRDAFWVRLVRDDRLLAIAQESLGPDLALFASHYIAKPPFDGKSVPWHQDGSYWPLDPMRVISLWLALDPTDEANGCMRVLPRTQHDRLTPEAEYVEQGEESAFERAMDPSEIDESRSVSIVLEPGDVSMHHPNVIHGSFVNRSPRWRRGLTIRYIPSSTRITIPQPHPAAFLLRGRGHANGNGWNPLPVQDDETSMRFSDQDAWNAACEEHNAKYAEFLSR